MGRAFVYLLTVVVLFLAVSCGSGGSVNGTPDDDVASVPDESGVDLNIDAEGGIVVETVVSDNSVEAGGTVDIDCKVTDGAGNPLDLEAQVVISGADGDETVEPGPTTFDTPGVYLVACQVAKGAVKDETPEEVVVALGSVASMTATLDPAAVEAGQTSQVTCVAADAAGNQVPMAAEVTADPAAGVTIEGQVVTGELQGEYSISCAAPEGAQSLPATLTVTPGPPSKYTASVAPSTVGVGESSTVGCTVQDAWGNSQDADWEVEAPEEIVVAGTSVSTTVAGDHKIKCKPKTALGGEKLQSATLTVLPGDAVGMNVYPKPDKDHFMIGDQVTIKHELVDQYDNVIEDAEIEPIVVVPDAGMELQPNKTDKYFFVGEGKFHLEVKAVAYPYSGEVDLICDGTGPKIVITYPDRAQTFTGPTNIVVTGYVEDAVSPVTSLTINGDVVDFDGTGGFGYPMNLTHGMNLIAGVATDSLDNVGKTFRSSFYSTAWLPVNNADPQGSMIESAIWAFLSDEFIDDGDHSDPPDDLATVVEKMMAGFDIAGLLPQEGIPLAAGCSVYLKDVAFDQPTVTLQSVDGGIHLVMHIPNLDMDFSIECCYELPFVGEYCDEYYGMVYAQQVVMDAYLFIGVDGDGNVNAELGPLAVEIEGLDVDIQGLVGSLLDPLVNVIVTVLKATLIEQFQQQFGDELPAMVEEVFAGLKEGQVIELPPLVGQGDPVELLLSLDFALLEFTFDGLEMIMDAAITAEKAVEHNPLGLLLRDGCMGAENEPFFLSKTGEMSAALAADFINEALYSVWNSGALTLNLSEEDLGTVDVSEFGIENLSVAVDMNYVPFVQTCGSGDKLELQLGDAFVHAKFFMMNMNWDIKIYMFLVLEVTPVILVTEEGITQIGIEIGEMKTAEVDVVEVGQDLLGKESMVEGLFKDILLPTLMDTLLGSLGGFDIPSFDLAALSPEIPEGTTISVDISELSSKLGYLVISGKLK